VTERISDKHFRFYSATLRTFVL